MDIQVLSTRKFKAGYELRRELWPRPGTDDFIELTSAYTPTGDWIGGSTWAYRLAKRGIKPEKVDPSHCVCSIGFCEREQKWYGWSHRAMFSFGIGDVVKENDCISLDPDGANVDYEKDIYLPVGFTAKTLDDCKRMAIAFAKSVS